MLNPLNKALFATSEKRASRRTFATDWEKSQWIINRYMRKGGIFADELPANTDKDEALKTIEKALTDKGYKKINDNFIIGTSTLSFRTLSNLLEISRQYWYQYIFNASVKLESARASISLCNRDYYGLTWNNSGALIYSSKPGIQPVEVPKQLAFALIHSSRQVNMKEARFR
jgi:hypothetical protein